VKVKGFPREDSRLLTEMVRKCVHCGFCNSTCPSYKVLGNELDGPRGRIHLITDLVRGESNDAIIRTHLDTCLTCRNCVATCPSGIEYGKIIALGRELAHAKFGRPFGDRLKRGMLLRLLSHPSMAGALLGLAGRMAWLLPRGLRRSLPRRERLWPLLNASPCTRKVACLEGCVQPGLTPNTNRALHNLLVRLGIELVPLGLSSCCGAFAHHSDRPDKARTQALAIMHTAQRRFTEGCEALVMTSSACVLEMREYPWLLRGDTAAKAQAEDFSRKVMDPSSLITPEAITALGIKTNASVAFHPPCTLQHGQGAERAGAVDELLQAAGLTLAPIAERNLCCGSAGVYSIMQPGVANRLREEKLANIIATRADFVATANVGCQFFLQQGLGERQRVWHWIELLEHLANKADMRYEH